MTHPQAHPASGSPEAVAIASVPGRSGASALARPDASTFARDMLAGFRCTPRSIAPKYFYDAQGSALFDRICELPEYYPTRTESAILHKHAADIAALAGPGAEIVEFGAGSLHKIRILLDAFDAPARYLPIDISGEHLTRAAAELSRHYPALQVHPVVADYTQRLLLAASPSGTGQRVGFFPGSTIGNFMPGEALHFLQVARQALHGGALLLGADLIKDPAALHAAYNDRDGITAAFNRNLLERANRELGADFEPRQFHHAAFYNAPLQRIEMHLVSRSRQQVRFCGETFLLAEGEAIHTEYSHKFTVDSLRALALQAGFEPGPVWTDPSRLFSVHWLRAPAL